MTPAFVSRLSPQQQRVLAVGLLVLAVVAALVLLAGPIVLFHRHYDVAIEDTSRRLELYRRVAAQAPDLRAALEVDEAEGRTAVLPRNTAPNLAGAELSDLVRAAIENNSGRITTSQSPAPREEGRFRQTFVTVQFFATTPALAKILAALDTQVPYVVVDNMTIRPLNAFRGFRPRPGQEPELNVQMDVSAWAFPELPKAAAQGRGRPRQNDGDRTMAMNGLDARVRRWLVWLLPFIVLALVIGWEADWGRKWRHVPVTDAAVVPQPVVGRRPAGIQADGHAGHAARHRGTRTCSTRPAGPRRWPRRRPRSDACSPASSCSRAR